MSKKVVPIDAKETVTRNAVVKVLEHHGVSVVMDGESVTCIKETIAETYIMPDRVNNRMLQHLKRKYDIPIHHFYYPPD